MKTLEDCVEIVRGGLGSPALFTCEHASQRLPDPWRWSDEDRWLADTHWAYDPGAAELARELAEGLGGVAVLSRFSRLLADPNRPEDAADLFRGTAEGRPVVLNRTIDDQEREARLAVHRGYHRAVDREVGASTATILFAVHTFTPVYEGTVRDVEIGVLFDEEIALAEALRAELSGDFRVGMNEPYSGKLGLMYSVDCHARAHRRRAIELEVRQDLAGEPAVRERVAERVAQVLRSLPL